MLRLIEVPSLCFLFAATWLTQGALSLAIIAGLTGILSIIVLIRKVSELDRIAKRQNQAVEQLDSLVTRIEGAVKSKEC